MSTPNTNTRLTCAIVNPQNEEGRAKLFATITRAGIQVWCKYCKAVHLVPREECLAAWERGESALVGSEHQVV